MAPSKKHRPLGLCTLGDDVRKNPETFIFLRPNQFLGRLPNKFKEVEDTAKTSPVGALSDSSNNKESLTTTHRKLRSDDSTAASHKKKKSGRTKRFREEYATLGIAEKCISVECMKVMGLDETVVRLQRKQGGQLDIRYLPQGNEDAYVNFVAQNIQRGGQP